MFAATVMHVEMCCCWCDACTKFFDATILHVQRCLGCLLVVSCMYNVSAGTMFHVHIVVLICVIYILCMYMYVYSSTPMRSLVPQVTNNLD